MPENTNKKILEQRLLKTLFVKEKMLVTSIFFISYNVSYHFEKKVSTFHSHLFCRL